MPKAEERRSAKALRRFASGKGSRRSLYGHGRVGTVRRAIRPLQVQGRKALFNVRAGGHSAYMWIDQRGSEILSQAECLRLAALAAKEGCVGHLAWTEGDRAPLVQPVNFAYRDHEVIVRLGEGHMAESVCGSLVAFEVDRVEADKHAAWSVLVRGLATLVTPGEIEQSGGPLPEPLVPLPGDHLLTIRADVVSGRRFVLSAAADRTA